MNIIVNKKKDVMMKRGTKKLKCMNWDPETSKWGEYAPDENGCREIVEVDSKTEKVLCWRCTSRSVTGVNKFGRANHE